MRKHIVVAAFLASTSALAQEVQTFKLELTASDIEIIQYSAGKTDDERLAALLAKMDAQIIMMQGAKAAIRGAGGGAAAGGSPPDPCRRGGNGGVSPRDCRR